MKTDNLVKKPGMQDLCFFYMHSYVFLGTE